jgi:hypothetical protein
MPQVRMHVTAVCIRKSAEQLSELKEEVARPPPTFVIDGDDDDLEECRQVCADHRVFMRRQSCITHAHARAGM